MHVELPFLSPASLSTSYHLLSQSVLIARKKFKFFLRERITIILTRERVGKEPNSSLSTVTPKGVTLYKQLFSGRPALD
jgi:hypothetical protein